MGSVGHNALNRASYPGSGSNVTMPNPEALAWKGLASGKPKSEAENEINELLYANVGAVDVPGMVGSGFRVQGSCVVWDLGCTGKKVDVRRGMWVER